MTYSWPALKTLKKITASLCASVALLGAGLTHSIELLADTHFSLKNAETIIIAAPASTDDPDTLSLTFSAFGKDFNALLTPNMSLFDNQSLVGVELYEGHLAGLPASWVRVSYVDGKISGAIYDGAELYMIDDAAIVMGAMEEGAATAAPTGLAIYKASDLTSTGGCAVEPGADAAFSLDELTEELSRSVDAAFAAGASRQLRVSIVADTQYVATSNGNTDGQIFSQMNIVDGIFSEQIGVELKITQIQALQNNGALSSFDPQGLLNQFRSYVNSGFVSNPGLSHLFTGKDLNGNVIGIAYLSAICGSFGVGLTEAGGRGTYGALTAAHEFGHNFGAPHDNQGGSPCVSTAGTFLMNPSINGSNQFSQCSRNQIASVLSSVNCLVNIDNPDPIPDPVAASMQSPTPGSVLSGTTAQFNWNRPAGTTNFDLLVGTNGAGSTNIRGSSVFNSTSLVVNNLPDDGETVFVRLWSFASGTWRFRDYTYTATTAGPQPDLVPADMGSPTPGSVLPGTTVQFSWNRPLGTNNFDLLVGTNGAGSTNIRSSSVFNATSLTVNNLPSDGSTVNVRLWSFNGGVWRFNDYTYTAVDETDEPDPVDPNDTRARLQSPAPNSTLTGTTQTFTWSQPAGAVAYDLIVGTTGPGSNNIRSSNILYTNTLGLSGLPNNNQTIYVRLWTFTFATGWQFVDYTLTAAGGTPNPDPNPNPGPQPGGAEITLPTPGSQLSGGFFAGFTSFSWTPFPDADSYTLVIGTQGPGSSDVANDEVPGIFSLTYVQGIPTNGGTIYVRLLTTVGNNVFYRDYTYQAASP